MNTQVVETTKPNLWDRFTEKFFNSHNYSARRKFYNSLWSILLGFIITIIVISFFGYNPFDVFASFFEDSNNNNIFIPTIVAFVFSGLAISICFKAGIFNIGVAGQMMASGFITLVILRKAILDHGSASNGMVILSIFLSLAIGIGCALIIAALKAYLGLNEVVTSIMLNWVIFFLIRFITHENMGAEGSGDDFLTSITDWSQGLTSGYFPSYDVPSFYFIDFGSWYTSAWAWILIVLAVVSAIAIWVVIRFTKFGYKIKMVGLSQTAADYSGTNKKNLIMITMAISGLLSGFAGFVWYFSTQFGVIDINITSGPLFVGFNAVAISLIVFDNPIAILFSSFIFSIIYVGSQNTTSYPFLPKEMTDVISGIFIYSAALAFVFSKFLPYQWTRNFILLSKHKEYRERYWKNWGHWFAYHFAWFSEKQKLLKLWSNHHKSWREIDKYFKNKTIDFEKKLSKGHKFDFEKLSLEDQIIYLEFIAKLKKQKDIQLAEAHYFDKNNIRAQRKEKYSIWKQEYEGIKKNILDQYKKQKEEKIYDSTKELEAKEQQRLKNKGGK